MHTETTGTQARLLDGFLARDVENRPAGSGDAGRGLQQQGRLADARITPDQHGGRRHQATAQHAIQFGYSGRTPRRRFGAAGQINERHPLAGEALGGGPGRGVIASSTMLFHSPHASQRPPHFGLTAPQL